MANSLTVPAGVSQPEVRAHWHTPVDLSEHLNNVAFTAASALGAGALNVWGNSLPLGTLPAGPMTVRGVPFTPVPADGTGPDNVRCAGQLVTLPPVEADWLHVLATAERAVEEQVYLHYQDGAVDPEWLRVSDFWPASARFGEVLAARSDRMHYRRHAQSRLEGQLWATRVPVVRRAAVAALRLPDNLSVHLFALTVEAVR